MNTLFKIFMVITLTVGFSAPAFAEGDEEAANKQHYEDLQAKLKHTKSKKEKAKVQKELDAAKLTWENSMECDPNAPENQDPSVSDSMSGKENMSTGAAQKPSKDSGARKSGSAGTK